MSFVLPRKAQKKWDKLDAKLNGARARILPLTAKVAGGRAPDEQRALNAQARADVERFTKQRDDVYDLAKAKWEDVVV